MTPHQNTVLAECLLMLALLGCGAQNGTDGHDGTNGTNGTNASIQTTAVSAGENCPNGGIKIEILQDGVIQESQTKYICNGWNGEQGTNGTNASIQTSAEPPGENCPNGGTRIDILEDGAVQPNKTQYVCHGENGANASIQTAPEPAGERCPNGGTRIDILIDGVILPDETQYICNGIDGREGCLGGQYRSREGICQPIPEGFVLIPAGSFVLTHDTELYSIGDKVALDSFVLGKTPVTVEQFEKCVAAGACTEEHFRTVADEPLCNYQRGEDFKNHPMNCVDWYAANEYCEWIDGWLPSEEEWEYASTHNGAEHLYTKYPWGDDEPVHCVTANYFMYIKDDGIYSFHYCDGLNEIIYTYEEYQENFYVRGDSSAVGTYSPVGDSPLGLVDMGGNVAEWTSSLRTTVSYPIAYTAKGGLSTSPAEFMEVTYREYGTPDFSPYSAHYRTVGFRCAK